MRPLVLLKNPGRHVRLHASEHLGSARAGEQTRDAFQLCHCPEQPNA